MIKSIVVLILLVPLISCVGAGLITSVHVEEQFNDKKWQCPSPNNVGVLYNCDPDAINVVTVNKINNLWGKPVNQYTIGSRQHLVYNRDVSWRGFVLYIVFPIPLVVPTGLNETTLIFENNILVDATSERGVENNAICGLHPTKTSGYGCTGWN